MDREEFRQLCTEYSAGILQGEELRRFEEYLRTASEAELTEFVEFVSTASMLPLALERQAPPARVKEQLMQKIQLSARAHESAERRTATFTATVPPPLKHPEPRRSWLPFGVTAVFLIMVIGFSIYVSNLMGTIEQQNTNLVTVQREKQQLATQLVELKDELTRKEELLKVISSKRIEVTFMGGQKINPVGYGKIIWDPEKGTAILQVSNLPAVPKDKDYQLWVIKDKKPISAGVFAVRDSAPSFFKIENLAVTNPKEIAAFAVTLEPKGGVPAPTGDMYILGSPRL